MQKSSINYAFLHLEFLFVSWREVFVIKGSRFHWARRALLCPLFHLPSGQRPTAWGWPLQEVSLKRKMRKAGQALSNALRWSQEKAAVSSLSGLGFFFSLPLPPLPGGWDVGLLPYLFVCLSHVVFLRELQRPVAHSQLLGTEVVPCIVLTLHARVFMLE